MELVTVFRYQLVMTRIVSIIVLLAIVAGHGVLDSAVAMADGTTTVSESQNTGNNIRVAMESTVLEFASAPIDCCGDDDTISPASYSHCQMDCGLSVSWAPLALPHLAQTALLFYQSGTIGINPGCLLRPPIA
jgi:hypothetical protein